MTQEKLQRRVHKSAEHTYWSDVEVAEFARAELEKAAEIADRYKEPLIADEIRKLME